MDVPQTGQIFEHILIMSSHLHRSTSRCISLTQKCTSRPASYRQPPANEDNGYILPFPHLQKLSSELLDTVFQFLETEQLLQVILANRALHAISIRLLYRHISVSNPLASVQCLKNLSSNCALAQMVRSLEISWINTLHSPTRNLFVLLRRALQNTRLLASLSIELSQSDGLAWIVEGLPIALTTFSSSLPCDASLARFLDSQSGITDLTLRGLTADRLNFMGNIVGHDFRNAAQSEMSFSLKPTSLPNLSELRAIHAGPETISPLIKNRPITQLSIPLYADSAPDVLDAIRVTSRTLQRLNIISFDPKAPDYLLAEVSTRLPNLEALHVVILLATCTPVRLLKIYTPLLKSFGRLKYITIMSAAVTSSDEEKEHNEERNIAKAWQEACPTLKTIILPRGKVWFCKNEKWTCLDD